MESESLHHALCHAPEQRRHATAFDHTLTLEFKGGELVQSVREGETLEYRFKEPKRMETFLLDTLRTPPSVPPRARARARPDRLSAACSPAARDDTTSEGCRLAREHEQCDQSRDWDAK